MTNDIGKRYKASEAEKAKVSGTGDAAKATRSGKQRKRAADDVFHDPNALLAQITKTPSVQIESNQPGDEKDPAREERKRKNGGQQNGGSDC